MESRVVGEDDEGVGGSVGGDVGLVGSRLVGSEGGVSWEFVGSGLCSGGAGVGGVLESVGLPGSSQYRPWEGSEVLLRGGLGYYGRNVDERLPSFESQFQELPLGYSPEGPYAYPAMGLGVPGTMSGALMNASGPPAPPSHLETSLRKRRAQGMYSKAAAVEAGGESRQPSLATSSSLDTHPTLVSQLRKKCRTGSLEESASESSSLQDTPGQVAAISSTDPSPESLSTQPDSFKPPTTNIINQHMIPSQPSLRQTLQPRQSKQRKQQPASSIDGDKPTKKKRKRCGECSGCQKKDNCGDCAPCRNEKSHQICKIRRCERLIEKKPKKISVSNIKSFFIH
uniref:CXXC-type domain-containing protein n=1 Tax=Lepeophtheirus salmonis TaxID=72036 RepID=A0A0K2UJL2_LEPSM